MTPNTGDTVRILPGATLDYGLTEGQEVKVIRQADVIDFMRGAPEGAIFVETPADPDAEGWGLEPSEYELVAA